MVAINLVAVGMQGPQGPPGASGTDASVGAPTVRAFPFTHTTADLVTGAALYTPTVGDILIDAWIEIDTAWDGTTPRADIGTFNDSSGLYAVLHSFIDMSAPDGLDQNGGAATLAELAGQSGPGGRRVVPVPFATTDPIRVTVTSSGQPNDSDPGSTQGAAILYLITATPGGSSEGGGGGGGGGVDYTMTTYGFVVEASSPCPYVTTKHGAFPLVGGDSVSGGVVDVVSVPVFTYPPGRVLASASVGVDGIPSSSDQFDLAFTLTVASLDGTNIMVVTGGANVAAGVDSANATLADCTGDATGSDLTFDPSTGVSTTAGGVYGIVASFNAGWD